MSAGAMTMAGRESARHKRGASTRGTAPFLTTIAPRTNSAPRPRSLLFSHWFTLTVVISLSTILGLT